MLVVAFALILAGCGGGDGDEAASTATVTVTDTVPSTPTSTTPSPTPESTANDSTPVVVESSGFQSPTGKLVCALDVVLEEPEAEDFAEASVRCTPVDATYVLPKRPADCEEEWGPDIGLGTSASILCIGDTVIQAADPGDRTEWPYPEVTTSSSGGQPVRVLPYDQSIQAGDIVCTMRTSGVECDNIKTHAGFTLSRSDYSIR